MNSTVFTESMINFVEAAKRFPGVRPNPATVFRWTQSGFRLKDGRVIILESARVGQRMYTSAEAVERFIDAMNPAPPKAAKSRIIKPSKTRRRSESSARLDRERVGV